MKKITKLLKPTNLGGIYFYFIELYSLNKHPSILLFMEIIIFMTNT